MTERVYKWTQDEQVGADELRDQIATLTSQRDQAVREGDEALELLEEQRADNRMLTARLGSMTASAERSVEILHRQDAEVQRLNTDLNKHGPFTCVGITQHREQVRDLQAEVQRLTGERASLEKLRSDLCSLAAVAHAAGMYDAYYAHNTSINRIDAILSAPTEKTDNA